MERRKQNFRPLSRHNTVLSSCAKPKLRRSSSLNDLAFPDDSSTSNTSALYAASSEFEKENIPVSLLISNPLTDLKAVLLKRSFLFNKQSQQIKELEKRMTALQDDFHNAKTDVQMSLNQLHQLNYLYKRNIVEKENDRLLKSGSLEVFQKFEQFKEVINHERNTLELKNISVSSKDKFEKLLAQADVAIKEFNQHHDLDTLQNFVSHLGKLEEAISQFNQSNGRYTQICEKINRLALHWKALKLINGSSS